MHRDSAETRDRDMVTEAPPPYALPYSLPLANPPFSTPPLRHPPKFGNVIPCRAMLISKTFKLPTPTCHSGTLVTDTIPSNCGYFRWCQCPLEFRPLTFFLFQGSSTLTQITLACMCIILTSNTHNTIELCSYPSTNGSTIIPYRLPFHTSTHHNPTKDSYERWEVM